MRWMAKVGTQTTKEHPYWLRNYVSAHMDVHSCVYNAQTLITVTSRNKDKKVNSEHIPRSLVDQERQLYILSDTSRVKGFS